MIRLARLCAILALALPLAAAAQSSSTASSAKRHQASGVVKSMDAAKGAVTIQHGPVGSLSWPAMTMSFIADDRKLLQNLKPGAKVEFEFVQQGSRYVITSIK